MARGKFLGFLATVGLAVFSSSAFADQTGCINLYSSKDVIVGTGNAGKSFLVPMDKVDAAPDTTLGWSPQFPANVTVEESGVYFVMVSGQVGYARNSQFIRNGEMSLWFVLNGQPVSGSATAQVITSAEETTMLVSQMTLSLERGDTIAVGYAASEESLAFLSFLATSYRPYVPSVTFSICRVD